MKSLSIRVWIFSLVVLASLVAAAADGRTISGIIEDPAGFPIPKAEISVTDAAGAIVAKLAANDLGQFTTSGLAPGKYTVNASAPSFKPAILTVQVTSAGTPVQHIVLNIAASAQEITVSATADPTSSDANVNGLQLDHDLLKSLPVKEDNPLAAAALFVDPATTGTEGVKIVVDGVETTDLDVPATSVKKVFFNKNPYSAEFSRPGKGRIEVLTRPGSGHRIHHRALLTMRDSRFDARNAFAATRPPMDRLLGELEMDGPLPHNKGTFYLGGDYLRDNQSAFVHALTPSGLLLDTVAAPERAGHFLARADWQLTPIHTLSFRYGIKKDYRKGQGAGGFNTAARAWNSDQLGQEFRVSDIAAVSANFTNELRFAFKHRANEQLGLRDAPARIVNGAFADGGAQASQQSRENLLELQNVTSAVRGKHVLRFGGTVKHRGFDVDDRSNFGGAFTFAGLVEFLQSRPLLFTQNTGNPAVSFGYTEYSWFAMDEVRVRPDLGIMFGLRYELQSNLADHNNLGPRFAVSYAPGSGRTVLRAGGGIFYDRLPSLVQQRALLLDGNHIRQIVLSNPDFTIVPAGTALLHAPLAIDRMAPGLQAPYLTEASVALEHKFGSKTSVSAEYTYLRGLKMLRMRDVNAPLPGTFVRPDGAFTNINEFESTSSSRSNSLNVTFRSAFRQFEFLSQYTLARSLDDASGPFSLPASSFDLRPEWGRSDSDCRHRFNVAAIMRLPHSFKLGTLASFSSGMPFNVTTGADNNLDGIVNDRPVGVTRNSGRGPGYADVDLRLSRRFTLVHRTESPDRAPYLEVRLDAFNVLNTVNAVNFVGNINSPLFGRANAALPPRQMQASIKMSF